MKEYIVIHFFNIIFIIIIISKLLSFVLNLSTKKKLADLDDISDQVSDIHLSVLEYRKKLIKAESNYKLLSDRHAVLLNTVTRAGGLKALVAGRKSQFSRDEIDLLIRLCHPDKHGGNPKANAMTQKLLDMR